MRIIRIENDENDAIRCHQKARKYNFIFLLRLTSSWSVNNHCRPLRFCVTEKIQRRRDNGSKYKLILVMIV